jgi:two-component system LytT family sensor kinase
MTRRLAFWLAVFAGWTLVVIVFAVSSSLTYAMTYQPPRWRYTFTMAATEWYVWAVFTPLVAWLANRLGPQLVRWWGLVLLAVVGVPIAFFKVTLTRVLRVATDGGAAYFQINDLVIQYILFWGIVLATLAWLHYRRSQERELRTSQLEALLAQARLQVLSMQLQPHFLFNTLNTIAELVHQEPAAAERMIGGLGHLLRESLHASLVDRVPIEREVALLDHYVEIQRARFGDRLVVEVSIDAAAARALVPTLLLQPIVENSIKHGIGARAGAGRIDVRIRRRGDTLTIDVEDDGRGIAGDAVREGVGLGNCRSRLEALYGADRFRVGLANREGGGTAVHIELPHEAEPTGAASR